MTATKPKVFKKGRRQRSGKGFSRQELKKAGLSRAEALRLDIPVDSRRRTVHEENVNVVKALLESSVRARKAEVRFEKVEAEFEEAEPEEAEPEEAEPEEAEPEEAEPEEAEAEPKKSKSERKSKKQASQSQSQ
jgi:Ran GTPase-activating protein (RanGAP) involved in mRNA processing and transport